ncbi:hypothetical protein Tco_0272263, partial [Tanacetum coccineum]
TDISQKDEKPSKKRQNRTRDGKVCEDEAQSKSRTDYANLGNFIYKRKKGEKGNEKKKDVEGLFFQHFSALFVGEADMAQITTTTFFLDDEPSAEEVYVPLLEIAINKQDWASSIKILGETASLSSGASSGTVSYPTPASVRNDRTLTEIIGTDEATICVGIVIRKSKSDMSAVRLYCLLHINIIHLLLRALYAMRGVKMGIEGTKYDLEYKSPILGGIRAVRIKGTSPA